MEPIIVGISGGSASGKTSFVKALADCFMPGQFTLISQDNYYKPIDQIQKDKNGVENFDLPHTIDHVAFAKDLEALKNGSEISVKEYTFNNAAAEPKMLTFSPAPIIVVEGIFVFYFPELFDQMNLKVFITAKEHLMIKRRILRDNTERGYDLTDVLYRWEHHVAPSYTTFIEPFKDEADLVVNNNSTFKVGLEVVATYLKNRLRA